jgi:hypothetical protein
MKRILAVLAVAALVVSPVLANEEAAAKEVTLKGKIAKTEVEKKVTFTLATADAKIELPALTKEQEILDVDVDVVAKAVTGADKKVTVKEVVSVKKAEAPKAEAKPAAEAAPKAEAPKAEAK